MKVWNWILQPTIKKWVFWNTLSPSNFSRSNLNESRKVEFCIFFNKFEIQLSPIKFLPPVNVQSTIFTECLEINLFVPDSKILSLYLVSF